MEHLRLWPLGWYFDANNINISSMIPEDCGVSRVQYKEMTTKTREFQIKTQCYSRQQSIHGAKKLLAYVRETYRLPHNLFFFFFYPNSCSDIVVKLHTLATFCGCHQTIER